MAKLKAVANPEYRILELGMNEYRELHLHYGWERPDQLWGPHGRLGMGFAVTTHNGSTGHREYRLNVLREVREALTLGELDAIMAHEVGHLVLGHVDEVAEAFETGVTVPQARRFKMELEADRWAMAHTSPEALGAGLRSGLLAAAMVVEGIDEHAALAMVEKQIEGDREIRYRLKLIDLRVRMRKWFGH